MTDELRPNPHDVTADPLSVPCPKCGVAAGETCPPPGPCGVRWPAARMDVRRAADEAQRKHTVATGLAKCRAALEEAGQRRRPRETPQPASGGAADPGMSTS